MGEKLKRDPPRWLDLPQAEEPEKEPEKKVQFKPRRIALVAEYIRDFDKWRAYQAVGYLGTYETCFEVFDSPVVKRMIKEQMTRVLATAREQSFMTIRELLRIATLDIRKLYDRNNKLKDIRTLDDNTAACIKGFKARRDRDGDLVLEMNTWNKVGALSELKEILGLADKEDDEQNPQEAAIEQKEWLDTMYESVPDDEDVE